MREWLLKPIGAGRLLYLSFQIYRSHFGKLFLLTLVFLGPYVILQSFLTYPLTDSPPFPDFGGNFSWQQFFKERLDRRLIQPRPEPAHLVLTFLLMLIYVYMLLPFCTVAVLYLVESVTQGKKPFWSDIFRKPFRKFGWLLGSTFVYSLLFIAGLVVLFISVGLVASFVYLFIKDGAKMASHTSIAALVTLGVFIGVGILLGLIYFYTRFFFYLAAVALEEQAGLGLGRSWELTAGSFWQLFVVFFLTSVVTLVFMLPFDLLAVIGASFLTQLPAIIVGLVLSPLQMVVYAAAYLNLKLKCKGLSE
jgi:hypothetical protein